jgi:hypothetical protein
MTRPTAANTFLFWLMLLLGTAALAPCLVLPAWFERQAQMECLRARETYLAALQQRLETARRQIEHLNDDPAYILRLAEQDFGGAFKLPDVETVWIDSGPPASDTSVPPMIASDTAAPGGDDLLPELDVFIDNAVRRYPEAALFLDDHTRPWIMGVGGGLLLTALGLLGFAGSRTRS